MSITRRVAFQGERGAYSESAAIGFFGPAIEPQPCETFERVFARVLEGECEHGVIPIENTLAGSIHQNYDLLARHNLVITGEYILRVEHALISLPGASIDRIRTVYSHPQALAQCDAYIRTHGWTREATYDTAGSVKLIAELGRLDAAAIAAPRAAATYGMQVLAENIEDDSQNYTRFLVISREPVAPSAPSKTSIVFSMPNAPGALFKALSVFALRDIDLTKIESRPIAGRPFDYWFYLDFAESAYEERGRRALSHLEEITNYLRVFGSYPRAEITPASDDPAAQPSLSGGKASMERMHS